MTRAASESVEGGLALFVSALQGSLAAGSAVGGVIYDAKGPGAALGVAAVVAAAGLVIVLVVVVTETRRLDRRGTRTGLPLLRGERLFGGEIATTRPARQASPTSWC